MGLERAFEKTEFLDWLSEFTERVFAGPDELEDSGNPE